MAQPTTYDRQYSFTGLAAADPSEPYTGTQLDGEFNAIKTTLDELLANIALIQADDGGLANGIVEEENLGFSLATGINPPSAWETATAYTTADSVFEGLVFYRCLVAHTSGTFATDLAAAKWVEIADFSDVLQDGIDTVDIVDGAVTADKMASNAVTTTKVLNSAITYAKMQNVSATDKLLGRVSASAGEIEEITFTDFAQTLLDDADAVTARATLGLTIGTHVQAYDAQLAQIAALSIVGGDLLYGSAADTIARLAKGTDGQILTLSSGLPSWSTYAATDSVAGLIELAVQSEMEAATDVARAVTPGRMQYHPGVAKFWARVWVNAGTPTITISHNVTSVTDTATGRLTITIGTDFSSAEWACAVTAEYDNSTSNVLVTAVDNGAQAAGTILIEAWTVDEATNQGNVDPAAWHIVGFGDQA